MKRINILVFLFFIAFISCANETILNPEGVYILVGGSRGLSIEAADQGGFIIREIHLLDEVFIKPEWQRAFVKQFEGNKITFCWLTGRRFDDAPDSNGIIVYELELNDNTLSGVYYFPENPKSRPLEISYSRLD